MNRTILWNIVSVSFFKMNDILKFFVFLQDFLVFVLPFLKNSLLSDQLKKIFYFTTFLGSLSLDPENDMKEEKCAICGDTDITMPYILKEFNYYF